MENSTSELQALPVKSPRKKSGIERPHDERTFSRSTRVKQENPPSPLARSALYKQPVWHHVNGGSDELKKWSTVVWKGFHGHMYFEPLRCRGLMSPDRADVFAERGKTQSMSKLPRVKACNHLKYAVDTTACRRQQEIIGSLVVASDVKIEDPKRTGGYMMSHDSRKKLYKGVVHKSTGIRECSPLLFNLTDNPSVGVSTAEASVRNPGKKSRLVPVIRQRRVFKGRNLAESRAKKLELQVYRISSDC